MKAFVISLGFMKKNLLPIAVTVLMLTVAMFILVTYIGQYNYAAYAMGVIEASVPDGAYYMSDAMDNFDGEGDGGEAELIEKIAELPAFSHIVDYVHTVSGGEGDAFYNVFLYDRAMRSAFRLDVDEGRWLSDSPSETEAVIGGIYVGDTKVGDKITLDDGVTVTVVGIFGEAAIYPSFNSGGTSLSADSLFGVNDTVVFLTGETLPDGAFVNENAYQSPNFYVAFDEDASEAERRELIACLEQVGTAAEHGEIIATSEAELAEWVATALPIPLFLIIISTINIVCISTVIVKKSMADISKYYLIGCSKRRGVALISVPLAAVFSFPCVFNLLSIFCFPNFLRAGEAASKIDYILNFGTAALVGAFFVLLMAIVSILPYAFYRRFSPISFYRRHA